MSQNSLVIFEKAAVLLANANTIQLAKELKDMAITAGEWAKRKGMGEEAIQHCRSYALEAERRMGELLAMTERAKGRLKKGPVVLGDDHGEQTPTLADLGISKNESAEAQAIAQLPKTEFEAIKSGKETKARAIRALKRKNKKAAYARKVEELSKNPKAGIEGPFDLILADPPWLYEFQESHSREIENHYDTLSVEEIAADIPDAKPSSVLFLWATAPKLLDALKVMAAWNFEYRTHAIWDKTKISQGYWFRGQHELLLVGTRAKFSPPQEEDRVASIFVEKRRGHSQKPECVYKWIERAFPLASKLEMYCRQPRPGWATHGNEC